LKAQEKRMVNGTKTGWPAELRTRRGARVWLAAGVLAAAGLMAGCEAAGSHRAVGPTGVVCRAVHSVKNDFSTHPHRSRSVESMTCGDCTPGTVGFFGWGASAHVCGAACSAPGYACPVCAQHPLAAVRD
jgi:hypothetical protein